MQAVFRCIVCDCDLRDRNGLHNHVKGKQHVKKACDYKRQVMGIPKQVRASVKALFLIFCSSATECAQGEDPQEGGAQ